MNLHESPRFVFSKTLGIGGTAEVALVRAIDRRGEAAVKYPREGTSADDFRRLVDREYALIANLRHPGVVKLLEPPCLDPLYILLEYCPGITLDRAGRIANLEQALSIISSAAATLEFLHTMGIIHADLKPQNIFLPQDYISTGNLLSSVKISDFSLGRRVDEPEGSRAGIGTVGYMAPEVILESRTSPQSDLFALGVVAYCLLTGRHPYLHGETDPQKINSRILEESPTHIAELRPDLPPEIGTMIHALLARTETERPRRALDVCRAIRDTSCRYRYERLLRPQYFMTTKTTHESFVSRYMEQSPLQSGWLESMTSGNLQSLRFILTANYICGRLQYGDGRFRSANLLSWPSQPRRQWLRNFSSSSLSVRKRLIRSAVLTECTPDERAAITGSGSSLCTEQAGFEMLRTFLRVPTLTRLSGRYARIAEKLGLGTRAALLYLQAGDLEKAERTAYEASFELRKKHDISSAVNLLKRVIAYAELGGKVNVVRELLMSLADTYKDSGDIERAFAFYQRLVDAYKNLPADKLLAETYKDLGDLYKFKQDFESGLKSLEQALEIYIQLGDDLEISHTYNNLGNMYWVNSEIKKALQAYRTALHLQRKLDAKADIASTLSNLGSVFCMLGRYRRGVHLLNISLDLKKEIGNMGEIARSLNNLGYVTHLSGESSRAVDLLTEALDLNQRIGSQKEMLYNLENLTFVMLRAGQLSESLDYLSQGIRLSRQLSDQPHLGVFNINKAVAFMRMGRFGEAALALKSVDSLCQMIDDKPLVTQHRLQTAHLRRFLGDPQGSATVAFEALSLARACQSPFDQLNALLHLVRLSPDPAHSAEARRIIDELHMERETSLLAFNRIEYLLESGETSQAQRELELILNSEIVIPEDIEQSRIHLLIVELLLAMSETSRAEHFLLSAKRAAEKAHLLPELAACLTIQGRLATGSGNYETAFGLYQRALKHFRTMAESIDEREDRDQFQANRTLQFLAKEIRALTDKLGEKRPIRA